MSSKLTGLFRTLTWDDFKGSPPASNPHNMLAETKAVSSEPFFSFSPEGKGAAKTWQLNDSIVINITIDSTKSWKLSSVASMTQQQKDKLLNHEQGHYNLVALMARDMFLELMQVKGIRTSIPQDASKICLDIQKRYKAVAQPLQDLYDSSSETDHGKTATKQSLWDGFIKTAFTKPRASQMSSPDGTVYKEEILSVLRSNGIPI